MSPRRPPLHWHPVRETRRPTSPLVYHRLTRGNRYFGAVEVEREGEHAGRWRAAGYPESGPPSPTRNAALGHFATVDAAKAAVRAWAERIETGYPPCGTCGHATWWAEDAWTCANRQCGDEWDRDHSPLYADPSGVAA